jgi:hypothetical protein
LQVGVKGEGGTQLSHALEAILFNGGILGVKKTVGDNIGNFGKFCRTEAAGSHGGGAKT